MPAGFKPTPPGQRRHKVLIQQDTATSRGSDGHIVSTWTTKTERWAKITQQGGGEITSGNRREGQVPSVVNIRYYGGLTSKMRLTLKGSTVAYNIEAIDNVLNLNIEQNLTVKEVR